MVGSAGVDRAAVRVARVVAAEIDALTRPHPSLFDAGPAPAAPDVAGKVGYLSNTLAAVLAQLGLTVAGRANIGMIDRTGDDATVAEIRAIRTGTQLAAGDLSGGDAADATGAPTYASELAVAYRLLHPGGDLLTWQRFAADVLMRVDAGGGWLHDEIGLLVSRQNGKTRLLSARALAGLLVLDDRIAHTAQDRELPRATFLACADLLDNRPYDRMVKRINRGAGKEQIEMIHGGYYKVLSSRPRSARGLEGITLLLVDEALELRDWSMLQALLSTQLAATRRQIVYASTAGHAWSLPLHQLRARAIDPDTPAPTRLAYMEWSADPGADPDDPVEWARANPALGEALTLEALSSLRARSPESVFRQENLGQFVHVVTHHAFDLDALEMGTVAQLPPPAGRDVAVAVEVDPSRTAAAVVAAWPLPDGRTAVELVAYPAADPLISDARLAATVIEWCDQYQPRHPVAFDPWSTGNVADLVAAAGYPTESVTGMEWVNASGHMVAEIAAGRVAHLGRPTLTGHIAGTGRRDGADGKWWFHRGDTPIVAATAATRAVWIVTRPRPTLHVY